MWNDSHIITGRIFDRKGQGMTRKKLEDCFKLSRSIEKLEERIVRLRSLSERITAVLDQTEGHGSGGVTDKIGEQVALLDELEWKLLDDKARFRLLSAEIRAWSKALGINQQALVRFRYIEGLPWATASMLAGYEGRQYEHAIVNILKTLPKQ